MGGIERKELLAIGNLEAIRQAAIELFAQVPEKFILASECIMPGDTLWKNLKICVETSRQHRTG